MKEGKGKRGHKKILTSHCQEDKECKRPPCPPTPSYSNPYWDWRTRPIALSSERAGNPYWITHLNKQIRHDNQLI